MNEPGIHGVEWIVVAFAISAIVFVVMFAAGIYIIMPALDRHAVRKGRPFWADRPWSIAVREVHRPWGTRWQWAIFEELTYYPPIKHAHGTSRSEEKAREKAAFAREMVLYHRMLGRQDEEARIAEARDPWTEAP